MIKPIDQMADIHGVSRSIEMHGQQVGYYQWRTPNLSGLFDQICTYLRITNQSSVMYVGCSTGGV